MKKYIGDAVYLEQRGHDFVLTTENGIRETNRILMEPEVLINFLRGIGLISYEFRAKQLEVPNDQI